MARMGPWKAFNNIGHRFRAGMVKDYLNSYMKETEADALLVLRTNGKNLKLIVEAVEVGEDCVVLQLKREKIAEDVGAGGYVAEERVDGGVDCEGEVEAAVEAVEECGAEDVPGADDEDVPISIIGAVIGEERISSCDFDEILRIGSCVEIVDETI